MEIQKLTTNTCEHRLMTQKRIWFVCQMASLFDAADCCVFRTCVLVFVSRRVVCMCVCFVVVDVQCRAPMLAVFHSFGMFCQLPFK